MVLAMRLNSITSPGRTLPVEGPRCLADSSLTLFLRFLRLNSGHRHQAKPSNFQRRTHSKKDGSEYGIRHPNQATAQNLLKTPTPSPCITESQRMTKTKKAKREGLEKHRQQQREKKRKAKERKNPSLPAKHRKR
jgi:hypothetical protein